MRIDARGLVRTKWWARQLQCECSASWERRPVDKRPAATARFRIAAASQEGPCARYRLSRGCGARVVSPGTAPYLRRALGLNRPAADLLDRDEAEVVRALPGELQLQHLRQGWAQGAAVVEGQQARGSRKRGAGSAEHGACVPARTSASFCVIAMVPRIVHAQRARRSLLEESFRPNSD